MSQEIPRSNTHLNLLQLRTPDNTDVRVTMTLEDFDYIDEMCVNTEEMRLAEFAAVDARRAYKICKVALNNLFSQNISAVTYNQESIATSDTATPQEVATISTNFIKTLPDEDIRNIDFSINIHPSEDDIRIFNIDPDTQYEFFKMRIEPPNLAA